jgi:hypothetical protein
MEALEGVGVVARAPALEEAMEINLVRRDIRTGEG